MAHITTEGFNFFGCLWRFQNEGTIFNGEVIQMEISENIYW